ncbi:MAG: hypothetical protein NC936_00890 [Candidatus Omnitrophica bacterium]|nr:hypothetical protein [Candidatus Omnitrophota bacterium]
MGGLAMSGLALLGQGIATALIALGIGYIVCDLADKQKDFLKVGGYILGIIIIILSLLMLINTLITSFGLSRRLSSLGLQQMPQSRRMQPYTPLQPQNQTQTEPSKK